MKKRLRINVLIVIIIIGPFSHNKSRIETGSSVSDEINSDLRLSANDVIIPSVPYHSQIKDYYCGPASLEMVFDYYGPDISQYEIADAARTDI